MSFAILRHGKIKSTSRGAAIAHNHRLGDVDQVNIDKGKKHLNRCFMGNGLAERIAEKLPAKVRKDAVVAVEVLLTSGPEFFDGIEKDRVELARNPKFLTWLEKSLDWAQKEFGRNLVDATLHMDESTPHLHLMVVPLTKDGRLCAKEIMARPELQRRQTQYAAAMAGCGLQRGEPAAETKRRHIGLKEDPSSGGKASYSQLAAQLAATQAELAKVRMFFDQQKKLNISNFYLINKLQAEAKEMEQALRTATACQQLTAVDDALATQALETMAVEASKTAQNAFSAKWAGIRQATESEAKVGTPVASYGRQVVLHVGRGKHVMHVVPDNETMPKDQKNEQRKAGISR